MSKIDLKDNEQRYQYYDELHYIPVSEKNEYWGAQVLYYNKGIGRRLVEPLVAKFYRDAEKGKISEAAYKQFVDPKLPDGSGGEAKYFTSDWKVCPVFMHLENIQEAEIKQIPVNLMVKAADEFMQHKKQKENARILGQKKFRSFINEMNKQFGLPLLKDDEDPFKYVEQMPEEGQEGAPQSQKPQTQRAGDIPVNLLDNIKNSIEDNEGMALYNDYIHKDGAEIACEIGIDHYLNKVNKFKNKVHRVIGDLKNFNCAVMEMYTSKTTGTPVYRYRDPSEIFTSPFSEIDGSDNTFYFYEVEMTFGEFSRMIGSKLTKDQLRLVFDKFKEYNNINTSFENLSPFAINAAKIKLGYHAFESQDMEVYVDYQVGGNPYFKKEDDDFYPNKRAREQYSAKRVERHYNVWYKFFYIPVDINFNAAQEADFKKQAALIFDFGKVQDQQRDGDDGRYVKSNLVVWKSDKMSFSKIVQLFAPQITKLWHQIQNDFSRSGPDGVIWADEIISAMMKYIDNGKGADSGATDGKNLKLEYIRLLNQTGTGIGSVLGQDGKPHNIPPFTKTSINSLATAGERMLRLMELYNLMRQSLGISEVGEGINPKARQNYKGIDASLRAGSNSRYFMQEGYMHFPVTLGEMTLNYLKDIVEEEGERLEEFTHIVGEANSMALQCIKDIPLHQMGLSVEPVLDDQLRQDIQEIAKAMATAGILEPDMIVFLKMIDNVKYAHAILALKIKQGRKRQMLAQQAQAKAEQQNKMMDHQLKLQEIAAQGKIKYDISEMMKQWDLKIDQLGNQIKLQGQLLVKDKINQSRTEEQIVQAHLDNKATEKENAQSDVAA